MSELDYFYMGLERPSIYYKIFRTIEIVQNCEDSWSYRKAQNDPLVDGLTNCNHSILGAAFRDISRRKKSGVATL